MEYRVRMGGLMRCCLASLDEHMTEVTTAPQEGDLASCKYGCELDGSMVFKDEAWQWVVSCDAPREGGGS